MEDNDQVYDDGELNFGIDTDTEKTMCQVFVLNHCSLFP